MNAEDEKLSQAAAGDEPGIPTRFPLGRSSQVGEGSLSGARHLPGRIDSTISLVPGGRPIFEEPFLNLLQRRLALQKSANSVIAGTTSDQIVKPDICSGWIAAAARVADRSQILENGLLALSTHVVASELQDPVIVQDSLKRYEKTIGALRTTIRSGYVTQAPKADIECIMLTSMACAKYEQAAASEQFFG
ncbi:MAG: hypothetical protein Q9218_006014 [Villophora microphyllina]